MTHEWSETKGTAAAYLHAWDRRDPSTMNCSGAPDPDIFQPTTEAGLADALEWCADCPVREMCGIVAIARGETGVWGGMLLTDGKPGSLPRKPGRPKKAAAA